MNFECKIERLKLYTCWLMQICSTFSVLRESKLRLLKTFCLCFSRSLHGANAGFTPSGQTGDGRTALNDKYGYWLHSTQTFLGRGRNCLLLHSRCGRFALRGQERLKSTFLISFLFFFLFLNSDLGTRTLGPSRSSFFPPLSSISVVTFWDHCCYFPGEGRASEGALSRAFTVCKTHRRCFEFL